jgi:hypothetical protein
MEHQQSPQQVIANPLSPEDEIEQVQAQIEQKRLANSYFLRHLIQRHPLLVLLGISAFLFVAIYSSVVSIFQIGVLKEETRSTSVVTNNPNTPPASSENSLPLWLLGAVTLGGAVGGVAIAKRLSNSSAELSQFFQQLQFSHQPKQQFPRSRQSILSLSALKLSEPKPTWAESSLESQLKIHSETNEVIILVEEDLSNDGQENFLEALELTTEEKNLTFEETSDLSPQMRSPTDTPPTCETASNSAGENDAYSPSRNPSLAEILDLRQKVSLATLLEIDN